MFSCCPVHCQRSLNSCCQRSYLSTDTETAKAHQCSLVGSGTKQLCNSSLAVPKAHVKPEKADSLKGAATWHPPHFQGLKRIPRDKRPHTFSYQRLVIIAPPCLLPQPFIWSAPSVPSRQHQHHCIFSLVPEAKPKAFWDKAKNGSLLNADQLLNRWVRNMSWPLAQKQKRPL